MFFGFSGFLPHVIGLFRLFSAPEAFMLPASKAGVRGGGGVGGGMMICIVYDDVADALSLTFGDVGDER